ncbi:MAG: S8 family serine peptidase [Crocinitomicaceae bacterium]
MSTTLSQALLICLISIPGFLNAQVSTSKIWATIEFEAVQTINQSEGLSSSNADLQEYINDFQISAIQQAVPSSRNVELLKVYEITCDCNSGSLIEAINKDNSILKKAEEAPEYTPLFTPNDYNLTFQNDYALDLINAEEAWSVSTGDSSVLISISDTNFDLNHEELQGTVVAYDSVFNYSNYYHGTAVAITAAGNTHNNEGKSSIGADCALQLLNMNYNAILDATYAGAKVINLSWSGGCYYSGYAQSIIDEAYNNGSIIVAAAGNGSTCGGASNYVYPAALNHVIAVSSVGPADNHERTMGDPATTHQHNDKVDLVAPGYDVALTVSSGWYLTGNGSSFATPYVSGLIGLMKSVQPCLTFEEVETILKTTAQNVDALNPTYAGLLGAGRIDAGAALQMTSTYLMEPDYNISSTVLCSSGEVLLQLTNYDSSQFNNVIWSNEDHGFSTTTTHSGLYELTLTDTAGCIFTDEIEVTVSSELAAQVKTTNLKCFEDHNGEIHASAFGGMAPYTYQWDDNTTGSDLTGLGAGIYNLTITDANNCLYSEQIELVSPEEIVIEGTVYCDEQGLEDGSIEVDVHGGTGNYEYIWSNGTNFEDLQFVGVGDYTLIVADDNQCQSEMNFTVCGEVAGTNGYENESFGIYPNPAKGTKVEISGEVINYSVYSSTGQLLVNESNKNTINISTFSSGIYVVVIQTSAGVISQKLQVL